MGSSKAARRDVAADTVVGFVLVTGISLLMMSVVMLVGAPALEQVQSRQQVDAMIGSYQRLDRGVSTLLSGAPAGTAPAWSVSMADGSLSIDEGGDHLWGFVVNRWQQGGEYKFWIGGYADGDDELTIKNDEESTTIAADEFQITATRWEADDDVATQTTESYANQLGKGDTYTLNDASFASGGMWELSGQTTHLKLMDLGNDAGNRTVAHVWLIDGGAVEWEQTSGGSMMRVLYQNTGILADQDNGQVLHNTPRIRPPNEEVAGKEKVFIRVVSLQGALSVGGRSTTEVVLSSQGNHPRVSTANATQAQLYPPVSTIEAWERHLTNEKAGFTYTWNSNEGGSLFVGDEAAAHYSAPDLSATLVETNINLARSGGT